MLITKNINRLLAAALAAVMLAALPAVCAAQRIEHSDGVGMDISDFHSLTFGGDPINGSIFAESELTVINIWQRWCGPCWAEMPAFLELHEFYSATAEADVRVIGALYYGSEPETIQEAIEFVEEHGFCWEHILMCEELELVACGGKPSDYIHIPQTLIVDRYGVVRSQTVGSISERDELFELVEGWLETLREDYERERGDVDGNGETDAVDALLAMRYALGAVTLDPDALLRGDFNGDGAVNVVDALMILRFALGLSPS